MGDPVAFLQELIRVPTEARPGPWGVKPMAASPCSTPSTKAR